MSSLPYLATVIVLVLISRTRGTAGSAAPASLGRSLRARPLNARSARTAAHAAELTVFPPEPGVKIMSKRIVFAAAAAAALALAAVTFRASAADKLKVGFIYVGPIGDFGWTYQHDVGRQAMVKALGDKVDTTFLENVTEGADAERSIEQLARTGHKLIFTTSFGFMDADDQGREEISERVLRARHRLQARQERGDLFGAASTKAATSRARSRRRCRRPACSATSARSRSPR